MVNQHDQEERGIDRRTVLKGAAAASAIGFVGLPAFSGSVAAASHLESMTVRSGTSSIVTGYRAGDDAGDFPTSTPDVSADLAWIHPAWSGTSHTFDTETRWIWHCDETSETTQSVGGNPTYYVKEPVAGDVVELEDTFTIPGSPVSGTLYITADNGYEVSLNGTDVGSAQVFDTSDTDWEDSDLGQTFINAQSGSWISVESFDVGSLLSNGSNTLTVLGGNEQQSVEDGESDGTVESNPGGVIYELDVEYKVADTFEFDLCAAQDIPVGTVSGVVEDDKITVTYNTTGGWELYETHLDIGDEMGDLHTNRPGNPQVGRFDLTGEHDGETEVTYEIPCGHPALSDVGTGDLTLYIAAHAVVAPDKDTSFDALEYGDSVGGLGAINPFLDIQSGYGDGNVVMSEDDEEPAFYGSSEQAGFGGGRFNGCLDPAGFADLASTGSGTERPHEYVFEVAEDVALAEFSLRMLDFGDYNPGTDMHHYAEMIAYDADGDVVDTDDLEYWSGGGVNPTSWSWDDPNNGGTLSGTLQDAGDACNATEGQPGNWVWNVAGEGITKITLEFGEGFDPNIGFNDLELVFEDETAWPCLDQDDVSRFVQRGNWATYVTVDPTVFDGCGSD